eukprot:11784706-Alexandrium_andersonii.AAC.1
MRADIGHAGERAGAHAACVECAARVRRTGRSIACAQTYPSVQIQVTVKVMLRMARRAVPTRDLAAARPCT